MSVTTGDVNARYSVIPFFPHNPLSLSSPPPPPVTLCSPPTSPFPFLFPHFPPHPPDHNFDLTTSIRILISRLLGTSCLHFIQQVFKRTSLGGKTLADVQKGKIAGAKCFFKQSSRFISSNSKKKKKKSELRRVVERCRMLPQPHTWGQMTFVHKGLGRRI
jgi:hypothetical protein